MKKLISLLAVLLLVSAFVFAGGKEAEVVEDGPVTLTIWYSISGNNGKFFEGLCSSFQEENPNITLEVTYSGSYADSATKISAAKMSGSQPDFILTSASQLYPGEDEYYLMEEKINDPEFNADGIFEGMLDYGRFKGRLCALPYGISTQVVYYNKDLIAASGLDYENNPPKTWDQLKEDAKLIKEKTGAWGFDTSDSNWLIKSMLSQKGNPVVELKKDGTVEPVFNNADGMYVASYWKSFIDEGVMPPAEHDNAEKKFLAGNLGIVAATSNRIGKWIANTDINIGAIEMPSFDGVNKALALGGSTCTILTTDKAKVEAAWKFVKYILNEENQTAYALFSGYLPIYKDALERDDVKEALSANELYSVALKQLDSAWAYTHFGEMGSMDNFLWYAVNEIELNAKTPEKAFNDAAENLKKEMI